MVNQKDYAYDLKLEKRKEQRRKKAYEEAKKMNKLKRSKKSTRISKKRIR